MTFRPSREARQPWTYVTASPTLKEWRGIVTVDTNRQRTGLQSPGRTKRHADSSLI